MMNLIFIFLNFKKILELVIPVSKYRDQFIQIIFLFYFN